jgi:hypothetical protein
MDAHEWLAELPENLKAQRRIIERIVELCQATPQARVFLVGCSIGRGAADEMSDVDSFLGTTSDGVEEVVSALYAALPEMGDLVDTMRHSYKGLTRIVAQFGGTVQLDLVIAPAITGLAFDEVALYDPDGLLTSERVKSADVVTADDIREWAFLGWNALANIVKYLSRGSLWEALDQLNDTRHRIWSLWAAARGTHYPVYGLTQVLDQDPNDLPERIETTVAGLDPDGLRAAALAAAGILDRVSRLAARVYDADLPDAMARHVTGLLTVTLT